MEILNDGMVEFESGIKSERTKELYHHYLNRFLEITEPEAPEKLLASSYGSEVRCRKGCCAVIVTEIVPDR